MKYGKVKKFFLFLIGKKRENYSTDFRPTVSVLIPAYNEEKTIANTIESIKAQTYPIEEIIVVDDSSTDKTAEIARSLGVKIVKTPKNTGTKARALNFGLQFVNTEVVVTVDADTVLRPDAIEKIIPALAQKNVLSACGFVIPQVRRTFWEIARLAQYLYYIGLNKSAQEHWGVPLVSSGCFSAYNTKLLKEMGGFPEGTIVEDMVLTWKGYLEGKRAKLVPKAISYPKDPENWRQYKAQLLRWNRGFLQAVSLFKLRLFKSPKLAFFVFWYLFSGMINPILWIFFFWYLAWFLRAHPFESFWSVLVFFGFFFELVVAFVVIVINGFRLKIAKEAILSYPFFWLIAPVDTYLWCLAFFKEWVLRKRLTVWEKGH